MSVNIFTPHHHTICLNRRSFFLTHIIIPALILGTLFVEFEATGFDLWLSAHFYDSETMQWPYKDYWVIQKLLHKGGRILFFLLVSGFLGCIVHAYKADSPLSLYRQSLLYLFMASIAGPTIILFLKKITHIYCPWDLQLFGSIRPYIRWYDRVTPGLPVGHCFPAAHAGSGFTFVCLYFFFLARDGQYKWFGLAFGLGLGMVNGFTQQMRGAHFLSHDVMSLGICWFVSLGLFLVFFRKTIQWIDPDALKLANIG